MEFSWTKEQQQVIDLRNRNILVSAAAGSGKTAVLVERILSKIGDSKNPLDIDRLLIVTFTNAAAGEMKERIRQALEEKVEADPENAHLQKQLTLIHHAQITTIHSFCLYVIRSNFHRIDLDPAFRIGDEGELNLLRADVLEKLLEEHYEAAEEDFLDFVETYVTGRDDGQLSELVMQCYDFSRSYPWPDEWLMGCRKNYEVETMDGLQQSGWMQYLLGQIKIQLEEYGRIYDRILSICEEEDGPYSYIEKFDLERQRIYGAAGHFSNYQEAADIVRGIRFETKPRRKKSDTYSEKKADIVSTLRDRVKAGIKAMQKAYFSKPMEQVLEDIKGAKGAANQLILLTKEFSARYTEEKRRKNLVDFNDLEHLALEILVKKEDGRICPTEVADQYAENYEEVMVDEYQDSNYVQEVLLNSVSSERFGRPNMFMVGDVKQSIYKFRLARPEIFMEKYSHYTAEESKHQKIELHQNFRSRESVLEGVNYFFYQIMHRQLGDIEYTEETALHPGLKYEPSKENVGGSTELLLMDLEELAEDAETVSSIEVDPENLTEREWEARMIAKRIDQLTDPKDGQLVWDKALGAYRRAEYRDIVILLRTIQGWADPFTEVLMSEGIPAYAESQSGYFTTIEIQTLLNLLRIIDNPIQDIPLAAVLHSPIADLSGEELAQLKIPYRTKEMGNGLYGAATFYLEHFSETVLGMKLQSFWNRLEDYRHKAAYLPLHELLLYLLSDTGYYEYVSAMPAGERRRANVDMLVEKAIQFESTAYHGLFQFVRYIEKLQKFSVDYGEASVIGENENTVRIMSIHKSKGLEFPIVILGGTAKRFNQQDSRSRVVFHPDFGVGIDYVNPKLRTRTPTLIKKIFQKKLALENLGEELRVLYVALTRAKEKLILTGVKPKLADYLDKQMKQADGTDEKINYESLSSATSYLDWLVSALSKHRAFMDVWKQTGNSMPSAGVLYHAPAEFTVTLIDPKQLLISAAEQLAVENLTKEVLENWNSDKVYDAEDAAEIEQVFSYSYNYNDLAKIQATMSVSQLKRMHLDETEVYQLVKEEEEEAPEQAGVPEITGTVPRFLQETKQVSGARRGTVYHKVLEYLTPVFPVTEKAIREGIDELKQKGVLTRQEAGLIWVPDLVAFYGSELGKKVLEAKEANRLFTEKQFIIGVPTEEIQPESRTTSEEFIMVQGVIDACFEENDQWVLVDYKTDRVPEEEGEEILRKRYGIQLDYYEKALRMLTEKTVKEKWIYSFCLKKAILL